MGWLEDWIAKCRAYYEAFGFPAESIFEVIKRGDMERLQKIIAYAKKYNPAELEVRENGGGIKPVSRAFYSNKSMMLLLLEAGADSNASLEWCRKLPMLHAACGSREFSRVRLLVLYNADYNHKRDNHGKTALELAQEFDRNTRNVLGAEDFLLTTVATVTKLRLYEQQGKEHAEWKRYEQAIESFRQVATIYWEFAEDEVRRSKATPLGYDPKEYLAERQLFGEHYRKHAFLNYRNIHDCYVELMKIRVTTELCKEYVRFLEETAEIFAAANYPGRAEYFRSEIAALGREEVVVDPDKTAADAVGGAEQYDLRLRRKGDCHEVPSEPVAGVAAGHGV